jgi:CRISPR/Cas system-associated exonuclease Cas4 (RecB family)
MGRPQQHLADVVRQHGSGNATEELRRILTRGLFALNEQKMAERIREKGTANKLNPYISDAGRCIRQVTYSLMNVKPSDPFTDDSLMNFLVGHAVEEAWAEILTAAGAEFVREERVEIPAGSTRVTGRKDFDGIRLLWHGAIVELKSTSSRSMSWTLKKGEQGKEDHRRQLNLYLYASGTPFGYLVYLVKDATRGEPILHAYLVELDEAQARNDLQAMASAHELAKASKLPAIPEGNKKSTFPCSYCVYRKLCWEPDANLTETLTASLEAAS